MKRILLALTLSLLVVGIVTASTPQRSVGPFGPPNPLGSGRDVCYSLPPDLNGLVGSSEIIGELNLESRMANALILVDDATVCLVRWWGGYYNNLNGCDDNEITTFNLYFYEDAGCFPGPVEEPLGTFVVTPTITFVDCQDDYPIYEYEAPITQPLSGDVTYWFVAQASDHAFPPQWGRLDSPDPGPCGYGAFWSPFFGFDVWGPACDLNLCIEPSAEFECVCEPVLVKASTWGALKGLYR